MKNRLDELLQMDPETRAARDRMTAGIASATSAGQLWDLYRTMALPAGAPLVQYTETQRAIYWTIAALAQVLARRPDALQGMVDEVAQYGLEHLQRRSGQ